jgi:hypothetical protein
MLHSQLYDPALSRQTVAERWELDEQHGISRCCRRFFASPRYRDRSFSTHIAQDIFPYIEAIGT